MRFLKRLFFLVAAGAVVIFAITLANHPGAPYVKERAERETYKDCMVAHMTMESTERELLCRMSSTKEGQAAIDDAMQKGLDGIRADQEKARLRAQSLPK